MKEIKRHPMKEIKRHHKKEVKRHAMKEFKAKIRGLLQSNPPSCRYHYPIWNIANHYPFCCFYSQLELKVNGESFRVLIRPNPNLL